MLFRSALKRPWILFSVLVALTIAFSFLMRAQDVQASPMGGAPQAIPVTVETLTRAPIRVWSEYSGRLTAVEEAEIRPEVSGRITEIRFQDGQAVKKGDILFVIDPRPYDAAAARAEAIVATARSQALFAKTELERAQGLIESKAIAQRQFDERKTAYDTALAAVKSADAELKQARLNLEHAYVRAPITGKAGRAELTVGNLVQPQNAPLLTRIVAGDYVYADFEVDEQTYLQAIRAHAKDASAERSIPVQMQLRSDNTSMFEGTIHAFDNRIDNNSGTIRARAKFANPDGSLIPGMFVSVRLGSSQEQQGLLVSERAIGTDQNKKYVYVIGEGNKVQYREVALGSSMQGKRLIFSGVESGERVIVDGLQHVRPDAVVEPKEAGLAPSASVAPAEATILQ